MLNSNLLSLISSPSTAGTNNPMMNSGLVGAGTPVNNTNFLPTSTFLIPQNTMRSASLSPSGTAETSNPLLALPNAAFNPSTNLSTAGAGSVFQGMTNPATGGSNPFVTPAPLSTIVGINPNPSISPPLSSSSTPFIQGAGNTNSTTLKALGLGDLLPYLDQISSTLPQGTTATPSAPTGMMNTSTAVASNPSSTTTPIFIVDPSLLKNPPAENTGASLDENPPSTAKTESNEAVLTQLDELQKSIDALPKPPSSIVTTGAKTNATPTVNYAPASTVTQLSNEVATLKASLNASKTSQESKDIEARLEKLQKTLEAVQAKSNTIASNTSISETPEPLPKTPALKIPVATTKNKTTKNT
jgi:hypothetical protein